MADLSAVKTQQQRMWAMGDFAMIAWNTVFPCELLCEALDLRAGQKVLDVACGSGNAALSAARRNCEAVGIDYVPALIDRARQRAAVERLRARFEVGDCEDIPAADASFDAVLSVYGSMFAPRPERAAQELVRVCRPGGRIGMANWTPDGFWGQAFGLQAKYLPPPPGLRPPPEWGTEQRLRELFGDAVSAMQINRRSALFRYRSARHWIEVFSTYFGPVMRTLEALDEERRRAYLADLEATLNRFNGSGDDTLVVRADYLEVVMTRKAA
ncbi:MAG TPA: class I SAM-dependent methyltransferase [Burkholderiales bacterium]|nr:class I SAM-dependent methyltransferase [Burkholderiales bacterium]